MKLRLRYSYIVIFLVSIMIICDCNFFRLFEIDDGIYKAINLMLVGITLLICVSHQNILKVCMKCGKFIYIYIGIIIAFLLFEYKYTMNIYGDLQSFYEFAKYNKHYVFVLLAIPLTYVFYVNDDYKKFMNNVLILVTIALGLVLLHAILYNSYGIELLNVGIYTRKLTRNGRMRMWDLSSLEGMAIIYGLYRFMCDKRKNILYLIQAIICVFSLIYVEQTRMMMIALAASILFLVVKTIKETEEIVAKGIIIVMLCALGGILIVPKLIDSFNKGISISYRLIEMQFTYRLLQSRGIFGMGLINVSMQKYLYYRGIYSNISLDDIGIIGYTAQAGIWSIGIYLFPMIRMAWILFHGEKNDFKVFLWSIYIYLLVTSATLLVIDSQRILMWPFCLALFEFYNIKFNVKKTINIDKNE